LRAGLRGAIRATRVWVGTVTKRTLGTP
jgi:hypothetical protein